MSLDCAPLRGLLRRCTYNGAACRKVIRKSRALPGMNPKAHMQLPLSMPATLTRDPWLEGPAVSDRYPFQDRLIFLHHSAVKSKGKMVLTRSLSHHARVGGHPVWFFADRNQMGSMRSIELTSSRLLPAQQAGSRGSLRSPLGRNDVVSFYFFGADFWRFISLTTF